MCMFYIIILMIIIIDQSLINNSVPSICAKQTCGMNRNQSILKRLYSSSIYGGVWLHIKPYSRLLSAPIKPIYTY